MINEVWIIDGSGLCLIHRNYRGIGQDPNLISGFFTAISNFAQEVGNSVIEKIQLVDLSFSCLFKNGLLFVVSSDKEDKPYPIVVKISKQFFKTFENRMFLFGELLKEYSKSEIQEFSLKIDEITQGTPKPIKRTTDIPERFIPERIDPLVKTLKRGSLEYKELYKQFALDGIDVLVSIDGKRSLRDIQDLLGLPPERVKEIVVFALKKKMLRGVLLPQDAALHRNNIYHVPNPIPSNKLIENATENTPSNPRDINPPQEDIDTSIIDDSIELNTDAPIRPVQPFPPNFPQEHDNLDPKEILEGLLGDKVIQFCFVCGDPLNLEFIDEHPIDISEGYVQCNQCGATYHEYCVREKGIFKKKRYKCPQCYHKGKLLDSNRF